MQDVPLDTPREATEEEEAPRGGHPAAGIKDLDFFADEGDSSGYLHTEDNERRGVKSKALKHIAGESGKHREIGK